MALVFSPLARAVFDAVQEALLVFDAGGRLVYANGAGQALLRDVGSPERRAATADELLPRLERRDARVITLSADGRMLGRAVFVSMAHGPGGGTLADRERRAILETLDATGWKLTECARRLGISRTTLWRRLNAYGLKRPRWR